ncbi:MAG: hypothetical protein SFV81_03065 [Pirellulaceae bacterium]|nr:hypothetical protein [Pirellulaceae bacterium]
MNTTAYKTDCSRKISLLGAITFAWALFLFNGAASADDWMTWPSTYTHEPVRGQRVDQYAQPVQPIARRDPTFQRSGYRNYRSTLQGATSADNMHIVEQWGAPVVPYEQWRFPFRPYGTPYDAWGPQAPYGMFNANINSNIGRPWNAAPHGYQAPPGSTPFMGQPPMGQPPMGQPNWYPGYPRWNSNQGYPTPTYVPNPSNGFPLSPQYQNQPWFDGTYPAEPPLDNRSDAEFFYRPQR